MTESRSEIAGPSSPRRHPLLPEGTSLQVSGPLIPQFQQAGLPCMARTILYATAYQFLPAGLNRVRELVTKDLQTESLFAAYGYNRHRRAFRISCNASDEAKVVAVFHGVIKSLISSELLDEYDEERPSRMIAHVLFDKDKKEVFPDGEGYDEVEYEITKSETEDQDSNAYSSLDPDYFGFECDWQLDMDDLEIEMVIPLAAQSLIEFLTGTKLVGDSTKQIIRISGKLVVDCELASNKLDVLRKYFDVPRFNFNHVFYSEIRSTFRVSIMPFPEIKKGFVETTLVDPCFLQIWPYAKLHELYTTRCFGFAKVQSRYILAGTKKLAPMAKSQKKKVSFQCWQGYIYPSKGNGLLDCNLHKEGTTIENWLESDLPQSPSQTISQMIQDLVKPPKPDSQTVETGKKVSLTGPSSSLEESRGSSGAAASQQLAIIQSNSHGLSPFRETVNPLDSKTISPTTIIGDRINKYLKIESLSLADQVQSLVDGDDADLSRPLFSASHIVLSRSLQNDDEDGPTRPLVAGDGSGQSRLLLGGDDLGSSRTMLNGGEVRPSRFLLDSKEARSSQPQPGGEKMNYSDLEFGLFAPEYKAGDSWLNYEKNDMDEVESSKGKGKEKEKEKNKKKASLSFTAATSDTADGLTDPCQYFKDEMQAGMEAILASLRDWQGEIVLEAQFGRLLIRPFSKRIVASTYRATSHEAPYLRDLLLANPTKVGFTKLTTTLSVDMETLVEMQDEARLPIWGEAYGHTVTYEYFCCHHEVFDEPCKPFVIEMNAETFETKVHTAPTQAGGIYVHCMLRNWDYFVSASGTRNLDEEYGGLAQEIADSTYIAPDQTDPGLTFALTSTAFHFTSIRVRRLTQYGSRDGKSILLVTEVQDLEIECMASEDELVVTAKIAAKKKNEPDRTKTMEVPRMWYEVAIRSVAAQEAFVENVALELGEESTWSEETLLLGGDGGRGVLVDIYLLANYVVKKLDGLGFYNMNGAGMVPAPAALEQFW